MCYVFIFGMLYLFEKHLGEEAMITVSLCMIVKNEEKVLARCLDSLVSLVDEMVIVDTGSTDRTRELRQDTARGSMNLTGWMISVQPGILHFPKPVASTFILRMQTRF